MKFFVRAFVDWYASGKRLWFPLALGLAFPLAFAPFGPETHFMLSAFPLLGCAILVPVFGFSMQRSARKAALDIYLYGVSASLGQYYWVAGVEAEGLRHLMILGSVVMSLFLALYILVPAFLFRILCRRFERSYVFIYPSVWVLFEFVRGYGELSFPWNLLGYSVGQSLPLAQLSSLSGVYGLSWLAVLGNVLLWEALRSYYVRENTAQKWLHVALFCIILAACGTWGGMRMSAGGPDGRRATVSVVQANMDQAHWASNSMDTCLEITGSLVMQAYRDKPELIVLAESALFCYLIRSTWVMRTVREWQQNTRTPMILGSLHWERRLGDGEELEYSVYNTAFFLDTGSLALEPYFKMKLLPFSEIMPFETQIPILNRVNLGEADFSRGTEEKIFSVGEAIRAAPFICFEMVFPDFVRRRVRAGANLLVNITNDGWWGRSTGAHHHAAMARMRCIESGVSMVRCANSGISMFVDQFGRVSKQTGIYERTVATDTVALAVVPTLYARFGNWILLISLIVVVGAVLYAITVRLRVRKKKRSEHAGR